MQSMSGGTTLQATQPDSVVQIVADSQGLPLVPLGQLPRAGTFWTVGNGLFPVPYPCPPSDSNAIFYALVPSGVFLVDTTGGAVPQPNRRQAMLGVSTSALVQGQVNSLLDLISQVQDAALDALFPGDGGDTNNYVYSASFQPLVLTANDLWLQIIGTTNTGTSMTSYLVIHTPWNVTNGIYDLFATTKAFSI